MGGRARELSSPLRRPHAIDCEDSITHFYLSVTLGCATCLELQHHIRRCQVHADALTTSVQCDFEALRGHEFFSGISWAGLDKEPAPELPSVRTLPDPTRDGSSMNWNLGDFDEDLLGTGEATTPLNVGKEASESVDEVSSPYAKHLREGESVVMSGLVSKKGFFWRRRQLILVKSVKACRLLYLDPVSLDSKGEIICDSTISVQCKGDRMEIKTESRMYVFMDTMKQPQRWVDEINRQIGIISE